MCGGSATSSGREGAAGRAIEQRETPVPARADEPQLHGRQCDGQAAQERRPWQTQQTRAFSSQVRCASGTGVDTERGGHEKKTPKGRNL